MPATKSMYRPAFSEEEVEALATILLEAYLMDIAKPPYIPEQPANSKRAFSPEMKLTHHGLIGKINTLRTKIANKALNPAYVVRKYVEPAIAMLEDLGAPEAEVNLLAGGETKETYWTRCYNKCMDDIDHCTVAEIEGYQEYRYLHDLMTSDEVTAHEAKSLKGN